MGYSEGRSFLTTIAYMQAPDSLLLQARFFTADRVVHKLLSGQSSQKGVDQKILVRPPKP